MVLLSLYCTEIPRSMVDMYRRPCGNVRVHAQKGLGGPYIPSLYIPNANRIRVSCFANQNLKPSKCASR